MGRKTSPRFRNVFVNGRYTGASGDATSSKNSVADSKLHVQETPRSGDQQDSARSRWQAAGRALRHRNFQLFFGGQLISLVGTWMQTVAQSWLVYRLTGSALLLGTVGFASQIPVFLVAPFGGTLADRYRRHRIILITQTSAMILAFVLS